LRKTPPEAADSCTDSFSPVAHSSHPIKLDQTFMANLPKSTRPSTHDPLSFKPPSQVSLSSQSSRLLPSSSSHDHYHNGSIDPRGNQDQLEKNGLNNSDLSLDEQSLHNINIDTRSEASTLKATQNNADNPKILYLELDALHVTLEKTVIPSWISRVPKKVGFSGNKSLKAAKCLVLCTVYIPMVLVPLWILGTHNEDRQILLETKSKLIAMTNILTSRSISAHQVDSFSSL
jgi:hypothetical protein